MEGSDRDSGAAVMGNCDGEIDQDLYNRGLVDYSGGRKDTEAAQYWVDYWAEQLRVEKVADLAISSAL